MNDKLSNVIEGNKMIQDMNYQLESGRLNLLPLKAKSLELAVEDYCTMQKELGLKVNRTILDEEMQYAMKIRRIRVLENEKDYLWYTNWAIILKEENIIIGYIILKGLPNEDGEVIIGYDIDENHRRKGYATEAIRRLFQWIFSNPKVSSVIADTEKVNIPSCKLLEHLGAIQYKETEELIWWKVDRLD
ncbi:MAG: acetyltransferase [Herbinix sp.]|jgi:RimJ/RimL family protein N-acetyltransferase|nr:acetyltransferase [Herbinix sp.]